MQRIQKIFIHSSERKTRIESSSTCRAAKPKPRLDRLNANKNINYDLTPSSTSASSSSSSSSYFSSEESIRTRSLDLYDGKTSFRVDGVDGEFEILCQTLGFSGIEDFAIPTEEYEAMKKVRSSSAPVVLSDAISPLVDWEKEVNDDNIDVSSRDCNAVGSSSDLVSTKCAETRDLGYPSNNVNSNRLNVIYSSLRDSVPVSNLILSDSSSGRSNEFRENGIKGLRPPVLAPPPSISSPLIDTERSTWDIVRAFVPDDDKSFSRLKGTSGWKRNKDDAEGDRRGRITSEEENNAPSESSSLTTSSSDDSSSRTTSLSSNSRNVRFRRRVIVEWQKGELLGRGSFGSVYEGIADDGFFFAVKEVSLLDQGDEGRQRILQLEQEIALLSQFEHENIVQYYGTKTDESRLYIFLELVTKGSLLSLYQKYCLKDSTVSGYTRQILHGLKYLHDKNVVHRDIKCANILVDTNGSVKLADFGLAKATKSNDVKSCKGTPFWMAPEVVRSRGYGLPADIWSLGCTVLEMLTGKFPYSNLECMPALYKIGQGERPHIPDSLSTDARDFILKCLQVHPSLRPTAAQLLDHPFVKRPLPSTSGAAASPRHVIGVSFPSRLLCQ